MCQWHDCVLDHNAQNPASEDGEPHRRQWHGCVDYCNGGPGFHHTRSQAGNLHQPASHSCKKPTTAAKSHEAPTELSGGQKRRRDVLSQHLHESVRPSCSMPAVADPHEPAASAVSQGPGLQPGDQPRAPEGRHPHPSPPYPALSALPEEHSSGADVTPAVIPAAGMLHPDRSRPVNPQQDAVDGSGKMSAMDVPQTRGKEGLEQVKALAYFDDFPKVSAAVQCRVGSGVAVLCATHPELAPHWLLPACSCHQELSHASSEQHVGADHEAHCDGEPYSTPSGLSVTDFNQITRT